jgi:hypothetical protein
MGGIVMAPLSPAERYFRCELEQKAETEVAADRDATTARSGIIPSVAVMTALAGLAAGGAWFLVDRLGRDEPPALRPALADAQAATSSSTAEPAARPAADPDDPTDIRSLVKSAAIRIDTPVQSPAAVARPAQPLPPMTEKAGPRAAEAVDPPRAPAANTASSSETSAPPLPTAAVRAAFQNAVPKVSAVAPEEVAPLIERSRVLIGQGNIAGARLVLERAASGRSGEALLRLAKTYDPVMLTRWHAVGVKPDAEKARELYRQAVELGTSDAPETTATLAQSTPAARHR